jgi:60 kDa SS-A/Ro ribonucleoprotein
MAINYARQFNRRITPQSQPIPGRTQVRNSGGAFSWEVDDWARLDRFLILGVEGGKYYITEQDLVKQNHGAIVRCIKADGVHAVNRIVEISDAGRAPTNDPAIFALALAVTHGDAQAKAHAFANLNKVCRIGTHLFHFAEYVNAMRGWSPVRELHPSERFCRPLPRLLRHRRVKSSNHELTIRDLTPNRAPGLVAVRSIFERRHLY